MAEKKTPNKNKSNHEKRIAQAAPKTSADKEARLAQERAEREKYKKKQEVAARTKKIAAVAFAVILIMAFAIPSAALMLSNSGKSSSSSYAAEIETYEKQLEQDPDNAQLYANIGSLYVQTGQTDLAVRNLEKAVELDPDDKVGAKTEAEAALADLLGTGQTDASSSADAGSNTSN